MNSNEKFERLKEMKESGIEIDYNIDLDILDMDFNDVLVTKEDHAGKKLLEKIDPNLGSVANRLIENKLDKKTLILDLLYPLKDMSYKTFLEKARETAMSIDLVGSWKPIIANLKPTKLYIWSTTPVEVIEYFVRNKVDPIYKGRAVVTATQVNVKNGVLTGNATRIIDQEEREKLQRLRNKKLYRDRFIS